MRKIIAAALLSAGIVKGELLRRQTSDASPAPCPVNHTVPLASPSASSSPGSLVLITMTHYTTVYPTADPTSQGNEVPTVSPNASAAPATSQPSLQPTPPGLGATSAQPCPPASPSSPPTPSQDSPSAAPEANSSPPAQGSNGGLSGFTWPSRPSSGSPPANSAPGSSNPADAPPATTPPPSSTTLGIEVIPITTLPASNNAAVRRGKPLLRDDEQQPSAGLHARDWYDDAFDSDVPYNNPKADNPMDRYPAIKRHHSSGESSGDSLAASPPPPTEKKREDDETARFSAFTLRARDHGTMTTSTTRRASSATKSGAAPAASRTGGSGDSRCPYPYPGVECSEPSVVVGRCPYAGQDC